MSSSDLLPLVGGSGGGGGNGGVAACPSGSMGSAGGGGGGGGALLIAANGTITLDGQIEANGGNGGASPEWPCAKGGAGGSGGAVRLLANTIAGAGTISARPGTRYDDGLASDFGAIRVEALNNTMGVSQTQPVATRTEPQILRRKPDQVRDAEGETLVPVVLSERGTSRGSRR